MQRGGIFCETPSPHQGTPRFFEKFFRKCVLYTRGFLEHRNKLESRSPAGVRWWPHSVVNNSLNFFCVDRIIGARP